MKKILISALAIFLCICLSLFSAGCTENNDLFAYVSELRQNIYEGKSQNYTVKAAYGFKESPFSSDGKAGEKIYKLTFRLPEKETEGITYTVKFTFENEEYGSVFAYNPVTGTLTAAVEIDNFTPQEFNITVSAGSSAEEVIMKSQIPENTLTVQQALTGLQQSQPDLIAGYRDENGVFSAEIYARVLVKNQKPYWYIGFDRGQSNIKALLVDGLTGEVLAVRDIF